MCTGVFRKQLRTSAEFMVAIRGLDMHLYFFINFYRKGGISGAINKEKDGKRNPVTRCAYEEIRVPEKREIVEIAWR